jgi:predicted nuclease of predicted toxin-antitoxin system
VKLLVDMNLSPRWTSFLTEAGFDAVHWSSVGQANAQDTDIMKWASKNGFIVLTHDLDFSAILAATRGSGPSVVQIRSEDVNPDVIGTKVIMALHQTKSELREGAVLSIEVSRMRLRLLPLKDREGYH